MSEADTEALLQGIKSAAGVSRGAFIATITDHGMVDLAQNMIRSLDAVPSKAPLLVVGMGSDLCHNFDRFERTTCVEVFKDAGSEDEVAWGTHDYWQMVFRKHVILTVTAVSNMSRHVIFSDPDIAYLDSPAGYLVSKSGDNDIFFSLNNALEPYATGVKDVAKKYERQGLEQVRIGNMRRRADVNTGLFLMRSSQAVTDLMMETMRIFKEQEFVYGHYQQYSLIEALKKVPDINIGVADGDRLVNGNVFWGHRHLLTRPDGVVAVHANWMDATLKRPCLKAAGFLLEQSDARRARLTFKPRWGVAKVDEKGKVLEC